MQKLVQFVLHADHARHTSAEFPCAGGHRQQCVVGELRPLQPQLRSEHFNPRGMNHLLT
jgi:hypothetical protein